jgi:phosphoglycerate dehydrogenase-like enzyme
MVSCMPVTPAQPTPVNVGPLPVAPDVEAAVRHNGGAGVRLPEAEVMIWQGHTGQGFADWLAAAPLAKWVQLPSAGVDWLFAESLYRPGMTWTCAKGAFGDAVAELALGLLIAGFRSLGVYARADRWLPEQGRTLSGSHVAILGAGGIATALLERLKPFGVETSVVRRHHRPLALADRVVTVDELPKVLSAADAVVLALPLTPATRHLIAAEELAAMRADAWLVNVGRGQLVDTSALLDALSDGRIAGAALDVTDPEPLPEGHPLWTMPSVILTPHVGATAPMSEGPFSHLVGENMRRWRAGQPLLGLVDADAGY